MNAVGELGATLNAALVVIGDRLGLYKAMAGAGALTPRELADRTQTNERYVREWLNAQAAGGYVTYADGRYTLPAEHALALADEDSPAFLPGAFQLMTAAVRDEPKIAEAFKSGAGVGWHQHSHDLFEGCERFFRPGYQHNLTQSWIPALDGVEDKLRLGARVADVGCGHGASTLIMADAYPASDFRGFDYHGESIAAATQKADQRAWFEVASAQDFPGKGYDLVTTFDCLHDMGDPVSAAAPHPRSARRRRHVAARRAVRRRHGRGEPEPGRPRLLRRLHARLHARVALAGGRPRARRPGRRGAPARRRHRRRLHADDAASPRRRSTSCSRCAREPSAVPRPRGVRDARRRAALLRGLRGRQGHDPAAPDLVDHPLAHVEGADRLPRAAFPGDHVRRARERQVGSPARRPRVHRGGVRGRRARRPGRHRRPTRPSSPVCRAARCGRRCWPPTTPSACAAWPTSGPPCRSRRRTRAGDLRPLRGGPAGRFRPLGDVQPPLLARGLPRLPGVLLRPDVQRPALDQADRGLRALGAGDRPGDARGHDVGALPVPARVLRGHGRPRAAARCW